MGNSVASKKAPSDGAYYVQSSDRIWEQTDVTPERNLWVAVITHLIRDYEDAVQSVTNAQRLLGQTSEYLRWPIAKMKNELNSDWIKEICGHINLGHHHIVNKFNSIDQQYGLPDVKWVSRIEDTFNKEALNGTANSAEDDRRKHLHLS